VKSEPQEIEVEVVDTIDSVPARTINDSPKPEPQWQDWSQWQGRVRKINLRWWPLWSILALLLIIPLLVIGLIVATCWIVLRGMARLPGGRR
jgi:hypothetical protein